MNGFRCGSSTVVLSSAECERHRYLILLIELIGFVGIVTQERGIHIGSEALQHARNRTTKRS